MATTMTSVFATRALLPEGWSDDVRLTVDEAGLIGSVEGGVTPKSADRHLGAGILLPAPGNLHSHAFQRAMAGMTEHRSGQQDDFWSWRTLMYRFLEVLNPDDVEAIAALVYVEMLEAGYAAVGEFHYVHHQPHGGPYANIAELGERIAAAASQTGIGLTHLPVLYTYGGAQRQELTGGQLRFGCDLDRYGDLVQASRAVIGRLPDDCRLGVAPHSLRATAPDQIEAAIALAGSGPVHIHIAEQQREVREIEAWLGARPVEWLLGHAPVDHKWCLIHATHMTEAETSGVVSSGAVAGLCPITEANLGDGAFNGKQFLGEGGRFGVGSDSNVRIALSEELRQLEYSQRQAHQARNVMATQAASTGSLLYCKALDGGAAALQRSAGALEPGRLADMVVVDGSHPSLLALDGDHLLDGWIFAADDRVVRDVWSAGRHCVTEGRHRHRDGVERRYRATMTDLLQRL